MDHEGYYADAFFVAPGRCFRMVTSTEPGSQGSPDHCPEPIEWRGRFQVRTGGEVDALVADEHAIARDDLRHVVLGLVAERAVDGVLGHGFRVPPWPAYTQPFTQSPEFSPAGMAYLTSTVQASARESPVL